MLAIRSITLLVLFAWPHAAVEGQDAAQPRFRMERLADGVYAAIRTEGSGNIVNGNAMVVVNRRDVLVVDATSSATDARELIAAIRRVTPLPVRWLVITHWHGDHAYGAQAFVEAWPEVEVISHPHTRTDLFGAGAENRAQYHASLPDAIAFLKGHLAAGTGLDDSTASASERALLAGDVAVAERYLADVPGLRVIEPTLTVSDRLTLVRDDREILIRHLGPGNTRGDLVVILPRERIVAAGDLVVWPTPYAFDSFLRPWADGLDTLRALEPVAVVPGHGPVLRDTRYLELLSTTFRGLIREADSLLAAGVPADSAARRVNVAAHREAFVAGDRARRQLWNWHFAGAAGRLAVAAAQHGGQREANGEK